MLKKARDWWCLLTMWRNLSCLIDLSCMVLFGGQRSIRYILSGFQWFRLCLSCCCLFLSFSFSDMSGIWVFTENRLGCRVVDAYFFGSHGYRNFFLSNEFDQLFSSLNKQRINLEGDLLIFFMFVGGRGRLLRLIHCRWTFNLSIILMSFHYLIKIIKRFTFISIIMKCITIISKYQLNHDSLNNNRSTIWVSSIVVESQDIFEYWNWTL